MYCTILYIASVLKLSDKISNCPQCFEVARRQMPEDPNELFQRAWLQIKEKELKGKIPTVQNYVGYFSKTCYRVKIDIFRELKKQRNEVNIIDRIERDFTDEFKDFIDSWSREQPEDNEERFYRGLIRILISVNFNKSEIIRMAKMGRQTLYIHLDTAYKKLIDDWTRYNASDTNNL